MHSAGVTSYEENGVLKKLVVPQILKQKKKKVVKVTKILPLKLMDKHAIATGKINISKSFRNKFKYFFQKHVSQIVIKQTRSCGEG